MSQLSIGKYKITRMTSTLSTVSKKCYIELAQLNKVIGKRSPSTLTPIMDFDKAVLLCALVGLAAGSPAQNVHNSSTYGEENMISEAHQAMRENVENNSASCKNSLWCSPNPDGQGISVAKKPCTCLKELRSVAMALIQDSLSSFMDISLVLMSLIDAISPYNSKTIESLNNRTIPHPNVETEVPNIDYSSKTSPLSALNTSEYFREIDLKKSAADNDNDNIVLVNEEDIEGSANKNTGTHVKVPKSDEDRSTEVAFLEQQPHVSDHSPEKDEPVFKTEAEIFKTESPPLLKDEEKLIDFGDMPEDIAPVLFSSWALGEANKNNNLQQKDGFEEKISTIVKDIIENKSPDFPTKTMMNGVSSLLAASADGNHANESLKYDESLTTESPKVDDQISTNLAKSSSPDDAIVNALIADETPTIPRVNVVDSIQQSEIGHSDASLNMAPDQGEVENERLLEEEEESAAENTGEALVKTLHDKDEESLSDKDQPHEATNSGSDQEETYMEPIWNQYSPLQGIASWPNLTSEETTFPNVANPTQYEDEKGNEPSSTTTELLTGEAIGSDQFNHSSMPATEISEMRNEKQDSSALEDAISDKNPEISSVIPLVPGTDNGPAQYEDQSTFSDEEDSSSPAGNQLLFPKTSLLKSLSSSSDFDGGKIQLSQQEIVDPKEGIYPSAEKIKDELKHGRAIEILKSKRHEQLDFSPEEINKVSQMFETSELLTGKISSKSTWRKFKTLFGLE